jgi:hypothetical protein
MVMKTGNGRHILIPFLFDEPFERIQEMNEILPFLISKSYQKMNNVISEIFLQFAKKYLSNNQADQGNYPNFSSIFLRVPGSVNIKMKYGVADIVQIEHEWIFEKDSIVTFGDLHPSTKLFYDFMTHMRLIAGFHILMVEMFLFLLLPVVVLPNTIWIPRPSLRFVNNGLSLFVV